MEHSLLVYLDVPIGQNNSNSYRIVVIYSNWLYVFFKFNFKFGLIFLLAFCVERKPK